MRCGQGSPTPGNLRLIETARIHCSQPSVDFGPPLAESDTRDNTLQACFTLPQLSVVSGEVSEDTWSLTHEAVTAQIPVQSPATWLVLKHRRRLFFLNHVERVEHWRMVWLGPDFQLSAPPGAISVKLVQNSPLR